MPAQILLFTPLVTDAEFPVLLAKVLVGGDVSALVVRRGARDEASYGDHVKSLLDIAQRAGCALLVENDCALAKKLAADGVHIVGDAREAKKAVAALKPDMIVGVGPISNRDDAMTIGEMDVDYLMFGAIEGQTSDDERELGSWWAQTFEVPAVLSEPAADPATVSPLGCEFLGVSDTVWSGPLAPDAAITALALRLENL